MKSRSSQVVLVAGMGGDAHSVGLNILRRVLSRAGFQVVYLGTQNKVADIQQASLEAHAVLLSNMDGHAVHYLHGVEQLNPPGGSALWYLGGNPSTQLAHDRPRLESLGFHQIFGGYVGPDAVVAQLDRDLGCGESLDGPRYIEQGSSRWSLQRLRSRLDRPVDTDFLDQRDEVLDSWSTGGGARALRANAERLASVPLLAQRQTDAQARGQLLMHPRCGVGTVSAQGRVFSTLHRAGADVLSFQIDSLTRNNLYEAVDLALNQPDEPSSGQGSLNGFPAVNHGVEAVFQLVATAGGVPMQVRHSTRDPRLLAEISFAGGVSSFEGGAICYNLPYYRDYDPAQAMHVWRYVDLLTAHYQREFGLPLDREFFGTLTAALVPPCIAISSCILEALMAADAGVTSVSLGYAEQGNRAQDVAAIRAMRTLAQRYLARFGHAEVRIATVYHQYMCAFPKDPMLARELLVGSAQTAVLAGATRMMLKTHVEATRIPSAEENAESLRMMRGALERGALPHLDERQVDLEYRLILAEAGAILEAALTRAQGDVHRAVVEAISDGTLDIPFSPSVWNAGQALTIRDGAGAVRFADPGAIPLPADVLKIHAAKVGERVARDARGIDELIAEDIVSVTEGRIAGWPLDAAADDFASRPRGTDVRAVSP